MSREQLYVDFETKGECKPSRMNKSSNNIGSFEKNWEPQDSTTTRSAISPWVAGVPNTTWLTGWRGSTTGSVSVPGRNEFGVRRSTTRSLSEYLGPWPEPDRPPHESETLAPEERARELVVLGLRMRDGIECRRVEEESGYTLDRLYDEDVLARLQDQGLLTRRPGRIQLTDRGFEVADAVFVELV